MSGLATRLLRALLPSWRFFDEIEPAPRLSFRLHAEAGDNGTWQRVELVGARPVGSLLLNPRGNLALAEHALLEQLLSDVAAPGIVSSDDVERLGSYELVLRLARAHARRAAGSALKRLQFKVTLRDADAPLSADEDVLTSRVHEL